MREENIGELNQCFVFELILVVERDVFLFVDDEHQFLTEMLGDHLDIFLVGALGHQQFFTDEERPVVLRRGDHHGRYGRRETGWQERCLSRTRQSLENQTWLDNAESSERITELPDMDGLV